eukprot:TRINITY_DN7542_c0_g1_i1.p1 TRINITY_DN7542_c0_g1~~TRINITY_DN7542_c0_g1_i1.p1  ORF type:complete len:256 (-),score=116.90 TRINITY_DN7542_c0_g1_i1:25-732(-)
MRLVGLTGGIATGKSTVSALLHDQGAVVIDCDELARSVLRKGSPGLKKVIECFGHEYLTPEGDLNREKLGELVFASPSKRRQLTGITRGPIMRLVIKAILYQWFVARADLVVLDMPLLYETRVYAWLVRCVVVVACPAPLQLQRLMARNGFTREVAQNRIDSQMPLAEKVRRADFVLDNSGDRASLERQVDQLCTQHLRALWPTGTTALAVTCLALLGALACAVLPGVALPSLAL